MDESVTAHSERILIIGPAWVGDMVMAQSLFISLKQRNPEVEIDVVAPAWSLPLLARMPEVNCAISLEVGHGKFGLFARFKLGRSLRSRRYDRAIVLPRSFKSALVPFFAGAKTRTGFRGEMRYGLLNDIRPLDKTALSQTVQRYVVLGEPDKAGLAPAIPLPALRIDPVNQGRLRQKLSLTTEQMVVGFMPGAEYGPAKCWPIENFAKLAGSLNDKGINVWIFGSGKEKALADKITSLAPQARNLCGQTRLEDVVDLMALTQSVVSNDSGLMHVACASGTRVIGIYGSSNPDYTPPLSENAKVVYLGLDCSPCFKRVCPLGHTNCLIQICFESVEEILVDGNEFISN
ncbi:ADP-heptose--lipooligosaccharide heptosyltransferase II [hydrothermal vent metagenome]|uniref:lipopolysaccharide heptosyltransferase II n=1 Tax=hydrothermal vent metagenome TaxID=652676 RepID=A0A3B1BE06_9ZZZZ